MIISSKSFRDNPKQFVQSPSNPIEFCFNLSKMKVDRFVKLVFESKLHLWKKERAIFNFEVNVALLINFPEQFELCFYFKYSRSYKVF